MIDERHNNMRNEVMKKVKFEQLKRRCLHDFMRKAREEIVGQRVKKNQLNMYEQQEDLNHQLQEEMERNLAQQRRDPADKKTEQERKMNEYKRDFVDFVKMKVTQEGAAQDVTR